MKFSTQTFIRWWDRLNLYSPIRRNFFLFLALWILLYMEYRDVVGTMDEEDVFLRKSVLEFLLTVFTDVWLAMIVISLITILISFITNRKQLKKKSTYRLTQTYDPKTLSSILEMRSEPLIKPLFGFLGMIFRVEEVLTREVPFERIGYKKYKADYELAMPFVKKYHFNFSYFLHKDLFRFFRLVSKLPVHKDFTQRSWKLDIDVEPTRQSLAHDEELHSDQIKRVRGEWLHNKAFEPSDDVRRIIWRVYAQSRELVVREQEIFSPYTSTVSFYISFLNNNSDLTQNPWVSEYMLTKFKNATWTIFKSLEAQEHMSVKYFPDQKMANLEAESMEEHDHEIISISEWISQPPLSDYIFEKDSFILCISPFISYDILTEFLLDFPKAIVFLVIPKISRSTEKRKKYNWKTVLYKDELTIEEQNLRLYRIMGNAKSYKELVEQKEKLLKDLNTNYYTIPV